MPWFQFGGAPGPAEPPPMATRRLVHCNWNADFYDCIGKPPKAKAKKAAAKAEAKAAVGSVGAAAPTE